MSISSIFTIGTVQTAMELGCIYALVALALFLSFSILNIADLSTDGCFTLGCAVCCQVTLMGHPILRCLPLGYAGVLSGYLTALLQTKLGVASIFGRHYCQYWPVYGESGGYGVFVNVECI